MKPIHQTNAYFENGTSPGHEPFKKKLYNRHVVLTEWKGEPASFLMKMCRHYRQMCVYLTSFSQNV